MDTYSEAHLFVAAIRVLEHQKKSPPALEDVCAMLRFSSESGHAISRNLKKLGIVETMEDPFSVKLAVADHLALEQIPRQEAEKNSIARELEEFQKKKKSSDKKTSDMFAEFEKKKKDKLSDIEAKFRQEMEKHRKG